MQNEKNIRDALRAVLEKLIEVAPTAEQEWPGLVRRAKDALASGDIDPAWASVCAACAEGTPPERCAYFGEPNGCNAPKIGQHPTAREELNKAANLCLFVKENCGDAQTARYMAEAIVAINEAVAQETAKVEQPGNAAALRKALEMALKDICKYCKDAARLKFRSEVCCESWCDSVRAIRAALAAPPRNCDVGTAEEQTRRLRENCEKYKPSCRGCKFFTDIQRENCWIKWAQMPYEKGDVE